jgi:hypothetical protein
MANNNKALVDLPFFELTNQAPVATSSLCAMTTASDNSDRFIYYMSSSNFYRYDTNGDTFQQLANPPIAPLTILDLNYTQYRGFHGRVLSATSTTITIPSPRGQVLDGATISIRNGTGQGQDRVMTFIKEIVNEVGVVTATTASSLTDGLKKWRVNQWAGYIVGIGYGTDAMQYKKILYNDTNTLYIADPNLQPHDPWNNQAYVAVAPYALPVATAGAQSHFQIMSTQYSVPTYTTIPDNTAFLLL